jgi:hypothetical protein
MMLLYDQMSPPLALESGAGGGAGSPAAGAEPVLYAVAGALHRLLPLSRERHLNIWRHVVGLYARARRRLPPLLRSLCEEAFVEELLGNEVFWALAGAGVSRDLYARASDHLPAVYAAAALLAARRDDLPLTVEDESLLAGK